MSSYKVTYFDVASRAETTKLLFHLADQPFEDIQITHEDWPAIKPTTPSGQLPLLEVDGITVCQSAAINNFLAKRFGFGGKNDIEALRIGMVVGCIEDMIMQIVRPVIYSPTDETKAANRKGAQQRLDQFWDKMEALLVSNNGGDGYFVGDSLSLADLFYLCRLTFADRAKLRMNWRKLPKLKALKERLLKHPKIAEWREKTKQETSFRLTYFDTEGRAETSRMLFALAGQTFDDVRINREDWMEIKECTPIGQLPILDVDDTTICQSHTIERYLANRFGFAGKTSMEKAQTDMVVDCVEDFVKVFIKIFVEQDASKKMELAQKAATEDTPAFLVNMEKMLTSNNGGDDYFVGSEITWADVAFFNIAGGFAKLDIPVDWTAYPKLKALRGKVETNPQIAGWIAKRPQPTVYELSHSGIKSTRILLSMGNLPNKVTRIPDEDWPNLKPSTPMGQLPILTFDGETYCQSNAINRFIAAKVGASGATSVENLRIDMVVDSIEDVKMQMRFLHMEKDEATKAQLQKYFCDEKAPLHLTKFEDLLKKNNNGDGFFVGDKMTWCDISFMDLIVTCPAYGFDLSVDKFPKLAALVERVKKQPQVAAWLEKNQE